MSECRVKNCIEYDENLRLFGKPNEKTLSLREKTVIECMLQTDVYEACEEYSRFIYKSVLFHSAGYKRLIKRNNSCILYGDNLLMEVTSILKIKQNNDVPTVIILGKTLAILANESICSYKNVSSNDFAFIVKETESFVCCEPSAIEKKCIKRIYGPDKFCIIPLVNTIETDWDWVTYRKIQVL